MPPLLARSPYRGQDARTLNARLRLLPRKKIEKMKCSVCRVQRQATQEQRVRGHREWPFGSMAVLPKAGLSWTVRSHSGHPGHQSLLALAPAQACSHPRRVYVIRCDGQL